MTRIQDDFQDFMSSTATVPPTLSEETIARVKRDIAPSFKQALTKMVGLHGIALALTLTVCPQFGLGPIGGGHGIMHMVMRFGEVACALFCAGILFGTTLVLARLCLSKHELRTVGSHALLTGSSVAGLSFAFFMLLGTLTASVVVNLANGVIWAIAGALILSITRWLQTPRAHT